MIPTGLLNLGNTCYINSVLQCFFMYDPDFTQALLQSDGVIIKLLFDIPNNLNKIIDHFTYFKKGQQHDAHEFLIKFIELVTPGHTLFLGQTKTSIKCKGCNSETNNYEDFNTIDLDVPSYPSSVTNLFIDYLKNEVQTDPKNLYYCDICKSEQVSRKKISLFKLPSRLIITLKKYHIKPNIKLDTYLHIRNGAGINKYRLSGIINHYGNLQYGHYNANVLINDKWYFINDQSVCLADTDGLEKPEAYILLYKLIKN